MRDESESEWWPEAAAAAAEPWPALASPPPPPTPSTLSSSSCWYISILGQCWRWTLRGGGDGPRSKQTTKVAVRKGRRLKVETLQTLGAVLRPTLQKVCYDTGTAAHTAHTQRTGKSCSPATFPLLCHHHSLAPERHSSPKPRTTSSSSFPFFSGSDRL